MTDTDIITPITVAEAERRARALRAEAAQEMFAALGRRLRRALSGLVSAADKPARA